MDTTPLKKEQKVDGVTDPDEVDDLEFNHLHLSEHLYKRTIEGSPMITYNRKRVDLKATPDLFRNTSSGTSSGSNSDLLSFHPSVTTPYKDAPQPTPPLTPEIPMSPLSTTSTPTTKTTEATAASAGIPTTTGKVVSQKVFVITSGSDTGAQHTTTPGHQENAQRTALLSGTGETSGCLYRASMAEALVWAPSVGVPTVAASMADILRYLQLNVNT